MMAMTRKKKPTRLSHQRPTPKRAPEPVVAPFVEHVQELRRRLYYIAVSVVVWGAVVYGVQHQIIAVLLRPAEGQHFIYTTPGGGLDFLFRICIYGGLILSLPVIIYNSLRFIEPLISRSSRQFILWGSAISGLLAAAGMIFGYFLGLPAALHFLLHQFRTAQIEPLVTIQSYFGFVVMYMVGSALLFQLPLLLILINRIKPFNPRRLGQLKYQRWVILVSFILAVLMNPTPNILSQLLIAVPFVAMYQVGLLLVAWVNRPKRPRRITQLAVKDIAIQQQRQKQPVRPLTVPLTPDQLLRKSPRRQPPSTRPNRVQPALAGISRPIPGRPPTRQGTLPRQRFMDFVPTSPVTTDN